MEEPNSNKKEEEKDLKAKQFDLVFLDPPTWSKSKHGAVDLVRDYQVCVRARVCVVVRWCFGAGRRRGLRGESWARQG